MASSVTKGFSVGDPLWRDAGGMAANKVLIELARGVGARSACSRWAQFTRRPRTEAGDAALPAIGGVRNDCSQSPPKSPSASIAQRRRTAAVPLYGSGPRGRMALVETFVTCRPKAGAAHAQGDVWPCSRCSANVTRGWAARRRCTTDLGLKMGRLGVRPPPMARARRSAADGLRPQRNGLETAGETRSC